MFSCRIQLLLIQLVLIYSTTIYPHILPVFSGIIVLYQWCLLLIGSYVKFGPK